MENQERNGKRSVLRIVGVYLVLALKNLAEVWAYLYPTKRQKIVSMLTDEVTLGDDGIRIAMCLEGFDHVMREVGV